MIAHSIKMKEEIKTFIKLVATYRTNINQIDRLQERYDYLFYQLENVKGISFEAKATSTNLLDAEIRKHELRDKLEIIENKIKMLKMINEYIDKVLQQIDEDIRCAIVEIYCYEKTYEEIARKLNYSKAGLYFKIVDAIEQALEKALF